MLPGRELDALIAEKVMGIPSRDVYLDPVKHYSTDISAAWEVVEKGFVESVVKLRDGRYYARPAQFDWNDKVDKEEMICGYDMDGTTGGYYEIPIYEKDTFGAISMTAPHAISLAALKALES